MNKETKEYIVNNLDSDLTKLALTKNKPANIDFEFVLAQISARQRIREKIVRFYSNFDLILPANLSLEQCSSEKSAEYKANLYKYNSSLDLTGGMGIDSIAFAEKAQSHTYVEINKELVRIFENNAAALNLQNVRIECSAAEEFLNNSNEIYDLIFIDPARRDEKGNKTYFLSHTYPNIVELYKKIEDRFGILMIKASPMLDISQACKELPQINKVIVLSINNECKELILIVDRHADRAIEYLAVDIRKDCIEELHYNRYETNILYSNPKNYLYEPNSSIMKIGKWELFPQENLYKISKNSHLFSSEKLVHGFSGRSFEIIAEEKYDKKALLKYLPAGKANISTRNFPVSVAEIRKKTGIKDGGDIYLFFTKLEDNSNIVLVCRKL